MPCPFKEGRPGLSFGLMATLRQSVVLYERSPSISLRGKTVRNNSAPPKWSKPWTDIPRPGDHIGAYTTERLAQMNREFTAAVERAFRPGRESSQAARRTYDVVLKQAKIDRL